MCRKFTVVLLSLLLSAITFSQQKFPSYFNQNDMELATPGTILFGLNGYVNPAELSFLSQPNIYFTWNDKNGDPNDLDNWGLFTSIFNVGFSVVNQSINSYSITDYKLSAALGSSELSLGFGYGWSSGNVNYFERSNLYTFGAIYRRQIFFLLI